MKDIKEYMLQTREQRRAHLQLDEPCCLRGGNSTNHKGVLAEYLGTTIPKGRILLCHACHNGACSNPRHLYWGTDRENLAIDRAEQPGGFKSPWDRTVEKYGLEEACRMNSQRRQGNLNGSGNRGKAKSPEHRKKIAEGVKRRYNSKTAPMM